MLKMVWESMGRRIALLIVCAGALGLGGCASIVSRVHYPVSIQSTPPGASVTIKNKHNDVIHHATTPAVIKLRAGGVCTRASYTILIKKDGYEPEIKTVKSCVDVCILGNAAFLPLFGAGVLGFGVDALTGAMWKIDSPPLHARLAPIPEPVSSLTPIPPRPQEDVQSPSPPAPPPAEEPARQKDEPPTPPPAPPKLDPQRPWT
jgi:hypothetical protein